MSDARAPDDASYILKAFTFTLKLFSRAVGDIFGFVNHYVRRPLRRVRRGVYFGMYLFFGFIIRFAHKLNSFILRLLAWDLPITLSLSEHVSSQTAGPRTQSIGGKIDATDVLI